MKHLYCALLYIAVHPKCFKIMWVGGGGGGGGVLFNYHQCADDYYYTVLFTIKISKYLGQMLMKVSM